MNSGFNLNFIAVAVAVFFGIAVMLWSAALKRVSGGELLVILGFVYCLAGLVQLGFGSDKFVTSGRGLVTAILCAAVYVCALLGFNYMYARVEGMQVATVTAISATYPLVVVVLASIMSSRLPTMREIAFLVLTVIGVVGLSLSGRH